MKDTFFRTMTWLHTWVGLLVCWILLLIFFAGSLSYFRHEISLWTAPQLHSNVFYSDTLKAQESQGLAMLETAQGYLTDKGAAAKDWQITMPTQRHPYLSYAWQEAPTEAHPRGRFTEHALDKDFAIVTDTHDSRGGNFFYRLHFDLQYLPVIAARWLVGLCTMFMFLALLSGIVIHKRIFKDLFSFRPNKGSRSWLDAHNVSAVLALPYHLMITYTGLITLMMMYMPWGALSAYQGDTQAFREQLHVRTMDQTLSGEFAKPIDLKLIAKAITQYVGPQSIKNISISGPYDANGRVKVYLDPQQTITDKRIPWVFNSSNGELISRPEAMTDAEPQNSASFVTHDVFMALHTGRFSEGLLRGFFFLCGMLGCAMIATGTLLWAVKIRQKQAKSLMLGQRPSTGLQLVEVLNFSFIAGLPLGTAVFFYANRLLPEAMLDRANWEAHSFFITLALLGLIGIVKSRAHASAEIGLSLWRHILALTALAYALLPVLNGFTSSQSVIDNLAHQQWGLAGFDLMCLLAAILLGLASLQVRRKQLSQTQCLKGFAWPSTHKVELTNNMFTGVKR